ncbi:MAG: phosphoketolase family protein [Candidatus Pacebacteria bacterium]|nr:phosphoketolase family protein [Candidatus Paceibacterota bacterium]MBP9866761.1 phosphoketolase family protein [Candidatus Paceibacterota bacterium]
MNNDKNFDAYIRAANYLSAAQIFLQDNFLLERPLSFDDIKPRLLGHWGTAPGINLLYAHLNALVQKHDINMLFVLGPGHGFAGLQANLFMEGTLSKYYPDLPQNFDGMKKMTKMFSWPYGFPSHTNPGTPGAILEGGELGYSLSVAYGAVLDNPDLIAVAMVGDGESETGPMATAWHLNKFIDPQTNGTVLPVLHRNGYKISGPTIFGRMSHEELESLFTGYGYHPYFVDGGEGVHARLSETLEACYNEIQEIKKTSPVSPRMPMIILTTEKGEGGIKTLHGKKIEGNFASHQVVATNAKTDPEELALVEEWLRSYRFNELFSPEHGFIDDIKALVPKEERRIGDNKHCFGGDAVYKDLSLPDVDADASDVTERGVTLSSNMKAAGNYLKRVIEHNEETKNFRIFSPDETYSNKLDAIFGATKRAFVWPHMDHDEDLAKNGRVIEMLSEHSLQGLMQGYVLTGRHGVFPSYEAFVQIIGSMTDQYIKFIRVAREIPWRGKVSSLNYILTSPGWAQEHNGFSHQNPGFIDTLLQKHGPFVHVYFPADKNMTLVVLKKSLESKQEVNAIVSGKADFPEWLTLREAKEAVDRGVMVWDFASDSNPDIVLSSVGDYLTKECLAAITILKEDIPEVRIRFVNIVELTATGIGSGNKSIPFSSFEDYFTHDKPVILNFHGYPETIKQKLFDQKSAHNRFFVHGYTEHGSTTTPFDMQVRNKTSRLHLSMEAVVLLEKNEVISPNKATELIHKYKTLLEEHLVYIKEHGEDPSYIANWQWKKIS